jgi:hypothetical protein
MEWALLNYVIRQKQHSLPNFLHGRPHNVAVSIVMRHCKRQHYYEGNEQSPAVVTGLHKRNLLAILMVNCRKRTKQTRIQDKAQAYPEWVSAFLTSNSYNILR